MKVSVVGVERVRSSIAFTLVIEGLVNELVLIDVDKKIW